MPRFAIDAYLRCRRGIEDFRNQSRTPEEVFSEIYRTKKWAKKGDLNGPFCSGGGSENDWIVAPYVEKIREKLSAWPQPPSVADLGCGDFSVGNQLVDHCSRYTACDVVPELIEHLRKTHVQPNLAFRHLDMIRDELPVADVCLIRQVFQHLSNSQIETVLGKLHRYKKAFITEHYPDDSALVIPNLDKVHGSAIRLFKNSGVYLDAPPFAQYVASLTLVLEVPSHSFDHSESSGLIRTYEVVLRG